MASLTIRKLDDAVRDELRLRAARNGRSVEDEVRGILRDASQNSASFPPPAPPATLPNRAGHPASVDPPPPTPITARAVAPRPADIRRPATGPAGLPGPETRVGGHTRPPRRNGRELERRGVAMIGRIAGEMAKAGEAGIGRMAEPLEIADAAERSLRPV